MKLLGDLLVGGKAITAEQRDRALSHAKKEKVRLGTALLDLGFLSEAFLLRALSVQRQVPPAPAIDLKQIRPDILRLIPPKLAARLRVVPFRRVGRQVSLAMRDPNDLPAIDEVSFLTGLAITPHIAPEMRIELALFAHYEVEIHERYHRLGKRLDAAEAPPPSEPSPMQELRRTASGSFAPVNVPPPVPAAAPPPPSLRGQAEKGHSGAFPAVHGDPWRTTSDAFERVKPPVVETFEEEVAAPAAPASPAAAAAPVVSAAPPVPAATPPSPANAAPSAAAPSRGAAPAPPAAPPAPAPAAVHEIDDEDVRLLRAEAPISAAPAVQSEIGGYESTGEIIPPTVAAPPESFDLVERLAAAESRDDVAEAVLQAASELVRRSALFIVQSDRVIGWAARPPAPDGLRELQIPFAEPSVFASLRNTQGFYVGPSPDLPANRRALQALGILGRASIAVVPVTVREKTVLFLLGEYDSGSPPPNVGSLKRLATMTAVALEIILLKSRLAQA